MFATLAALPLVLCPSPVTLGVQEDEGFVERALEVGLDHRVLGGWDDFGDGAKRVRDWVQTGIALGDLNGDGRTDVVAVGGSLPNQVLLQAPDGTFAPFAGAGIRSGELDRVPALGDYDRDGDLDLFIGALEGSGSGPLPGRSRLYRNDGQARFTDVTAASGTFGNGRTVHAQWADVDLDGWLDLYTSEFHLTPNLYYRNNADGTFTELGAELGLDDDGSAHASSVVDVDDDGWPDVLVGNDHLVGKIVGIPPSENEGDAHFAAVGDGTFVDVTPGSGFGQERGIMGLGFGDADHDGRLDCYKTDIGSNWFLASRGWPASGTPWQDGTALLGLSDTVVPFHDQPGQFGPTSGWATMFLDVDLDSWVDLFVVNGHVAGVNPNFSQLPRFQPNGLYRGLGPTQAFAFESAAGQFGLYDEYDDRAGAMGDLDRDGDVDLLVVETAGRLRYFENRVERHGRGALTVRLETGTSAPSGIGAVVRYTGDDGHPRLRGIGLDAPTASHHEHLAHFGLGHEASVDLLVELPSGIVLSVPGVPRDTDLTVVEPTLIELSTRHVRATGTGPLSLPDEVLVRVHPHDASGQPLGPEAAVQVELPGLLALGPVTFEAGAHQRRFAAPESPGEFRVEATFDGWSPRIRPRVHAVGAVDAARSTVRVDTLALRAGSDDELRVEVAPRDEKGVGLGPGRSVSIEFDGGLPLGEVVDLGDGRYLRRFRAPEEPGRIPVFAHADGVPLEGVTLVDVAGPAAAATTSVVIQPPHPHHAASPRQTRLTVVPRDAQGFRLGGRAEVELAVEWSTGPAAPDDTRGANGPATAGPQSALAAAGVPTAPVEPTEAVRGVEGFEDLPRVDGGHLFAVERSEQTDPGIVARVSIRIDGVLVHEGVPVRFEL